VTTQAHIGGNGMGLLFCQRMLLSMGSKIVVESELDQGTTISLLFGPLEHRRRSGLIVL
jgi:two-component system, response regulator PhcR